MVVLFLFHFFSHPNQAPIYESQQCYIPSCFEDVVYVTSKTLWS